MTTAVQYIKKINVRTHDVGEAIGNLLVHAFHLLALFAIGGTIMWAAVSKPWRTHRQSKNRLLMDEI